MDHYPDCMSCENSYRCADGTSITGGAMSCMYAHETVHMDMAAVVKTTDSTKLSYKQLERLTPAERSEYARERNRGHK